MNLRVKKRNGRLEPFNADKINTFVERCCDGLDNVSASEIIVDMKSSFYDKILTSDIDKSLELTSRSKIYKHPNYSYASARVLLSCLYKEVLKESVVSDTFSSDYRSIFIKNIKRGVKDGILDERLLDYDLKALSEFIDPDRDFILKYAGIKNIYDRYLLRTDDKILETPQAFYMRVAMGVMLEEHVDNKINLVKSLYDTYSNHLGMASTPTLFNSGTVHSQLSSCFKSDALITTLEGQTPICKIKEGDLVLTQGGTFEKVLNTRRKENDKKIVKLGLKNLSSAIFDFESTEDHKVFGLKADSQSPQWYEAGDLDVGDSVQLGKSNNCSEFSFFDNESLFKMVPFYFKFGSLTSKSIGFIFPSTDIDFSSKFLELSKEFDRSVSKIGEKIIVSFHSEHLIQFFELFSNTANTFAILNNVKDNIKLNFVKDIFDFYRLSNDSDKFSMISINKSFIHLVYQMLISLGLDKVSVIKIDTSHELNTSGVNLYQITYNGQIPDSVNLEDKSKDLFVKIIKKETESYKGDVYDLEVENDHTFVAHGVVVHNCYLSEMEDSVDGIFDGLWQEARKSKYAGGLGFHASKIRGTNSEIKGTHGKSSGLIPWLKIYNDMLIACNQAGKRPGSGCAYLEPWHIDFEDFVDLRKVAGEERRRCHDMNTASWIPDLFVKRVKDDEDWTLFCPSEAKGLVDSFGEDFNQKYLQYEKQSQEGSIKIFKKVKAKSLWKKMLKSLYETGHPWMTYKDNANLRYSNIHEGVIHGSNLCCITGDQRVPSSKGFLTVKQLSDNFEKEEMFIVGRSAVERSTPLAKTLEDQPIFEISTFHGFKHKVTADHPVWVKDKGWVQCQFLKGGEEIETQQVPGLWGKGAVNIQPFSEGFFTSKKLDSDSEFKADLNRMWLANIIQWHDYIKGLFLNKLSYKKDLDKHIFYYSCEDDEFLSDLQIIFANFGMLTRLSEDSILIEDEFSILCLQKILSSENPEKDLDVFPDLFNIDLSNVDVSKKHNYTTVTKITQLENEDVYCLKVLSNDDKAWTCNGLITKNTEIFLHTKHSEYKDGKKTKVGETAVCNLSSIVLCNHLTENNEIDYPKLANTIKTLVRALDNVVDVNFYPTEEAEKSNKRHRPVGLGTMGWAQVFAAYDIPCDSEEAISLSGKIMEFISLHAIWNSSLLAKEKGKYLSYEGSKWSKNEFPIDTWNQLMDFKNSPELKGKESLVKEWEQVRQSVSEYGMRNSNVMAIAPNASIAYQIGCEQSIEPFFTMLFVYENESGNYYMLNSSFVSKMESLGLWSEGLAEALKEADGDVSLLKGIPDKVVDVYKNSFDRDQMMLIKANAEKQKWTDQGISFNVYNKYSSLKFLSDIYIFANEQGLKSTYYLRNLPASKTQKVTLNKPQEPTESEIAEFQEKLNRAKAAAESGQNCEMCE